MENGIPYAAAQIKSNKNSNRLIKNRNFGEFHLVVWLVMAVDE